jgi:hypothetical protein
MRTKYASAAVWLVDFVRLIAVVESKRTAGVLDPDGTRAVWGSIEQHNKCPWEEQTNKKMDDQRHYKLGSNSRKKERRNKHT